ncbi:MAG TPA: hypothetical protein GXZ60_00915 [Intrasporangiaceae bacterium]|nr:hypothetical protein [Intrasporangiaceae bacterium]
MIPFRPLGLGEIYTAAFKIIKGNPASTIGAALIVALIALIPTTPLGVWVASQASSDFLDPTAPVGDGTVADAILTTTGQYIPTIAGSLSTVALAGFIAYVTGQAVLGRKVKLPETWRGARGHLWRVIAVSLLISTLMFAVVAAFITPGIVLIIQGALREDGTLILIGVLTLVGLILLLIPVALWLWTRLAFAAPAVVLERAGIGRAMRRSWQLTRFPGFWRVLGIRLLTTMVISMVAQVLAMPLGFVMFAMIALGNADAGTIVSTQVIVSAFVTLVAAALTTPATATVDTLLYVDSRIRVDALDVQLIQAVEGRAPLPWEAALEPSQHPTG